MLSSTTKGVSSPVAKFWTTPTTHVEGRPVLVLRKCLTLLKRSVDIRKVPGSAGVFAFFGHRVQAIRS